MWSPLTLYYKSLVSSKFIQPFFSLLKTTHTHKKQQFRNTKVSLEFIVLVILT